MKFTTREDIDAPIGAVWTAVTDARRFEDKAIRKGVQVQRLSEDAVDLGASWTARFDYRGIRREMESVVTGFEAPRLLELDGNVGGLDGFLTVELSELSPETTRLELTLEIRPESLTAKMLVQTMRMAKGRLDKRFRKRVRHFAKRIARQAKSAQGA
ncbi:SRPBCC family protein [Tropicimonas sp. TH_r6]|uniref:SRPBCC family protein n=1 Tax=Tropicimonas sp. TH_r6 TaxID=3082085 RepID=UPI00295515BD|nr:SRPBCC family protein [Tropicimonas sp. TH_r6]MDV7144620.1 SRPBCC family protein [Tropicimonas sp. TH_r6]